MNTFKIIAVTHKTTPLEHIGKLHVDDAGQPVILPAMKAAFGLEELMFLSTCNRVEIVLKTQEEITTDFIDRLFRFVNPSLDATVSQSLIAQASVYEGERALEHLFEVASSLDSLVVGEREIITQVRRAYEQCQQLGLTGDLVRLAMKQTIETAKDIFTNTDIARNPVSVVSLAYRELRDLGIKNNARFVLVGAGETNANMAKYLQKHQYANFAIFNRTLSKAETLASELGGIAYPLEQLASYEGGFDVLITCTGSSDPVITEAIYNQLLKGDTSKKVVIDLAVPADLDVKILSQHSLHYIDVNSLKERAQANMAKREAEVEKCREILAERITEFRQLHRERMVEQAFGQIPKQIKAIKESAINEVFAKEISTLDTSSKEVLEKVLAYMEKKYNAVTMKTAKEVLIEKQD